MPLSKFGSMASSETGSITSSSMDSAAEFWDDEKFEMLRRVHKYIKSQAKGEVNEIEELVCQTLPTLARHFDGEALDSLKRANPWLAVFEPDSLLDWEKAKRAFMDNGPSFFDVLASFTDLMRFENQIGIMLGEDVDFYTQLLLALRDEAEHHKEGYENGDPGSIDERVAQRSDSLANGVLDENVTGGVTKNRINMLLRKVVKAEENRWTYNTKTLR